MLSPKLISVPCNLEEQFYTKVKYNFKLHVLLCLKGTNWNRQDILHKIYLLDGYRCHKVVRYGSNWSHFHIKLTEEQKAKDAIGFFKTMNSDLSAVLVDDLLKDWYDFELRSNYSPPWTLAIIDVVGTTPRCMNFLTEFLLNSILEDFGQPYLLPYTAALTEAHVQILFSSMTEALAACMAFGQWYKMNQKSDQFFYRVRISPSNKENLLIKNSGGIPEEAFKLDYFLTERSFNRPDRSSGVEQNGSRSNFHCKSNQKDVKKAFDAEKSYRSHRSNLSQVKFRTPLICIPVIAPRPGNSEAAESENVLRSFIDAPELRNQFISRPAAVGIKSAVGFPTSEDRGYGQTAAQESLRTFDKVQASDALSNCIEISNSFQPMSLQSVPYEMAQNYYNGKALVFERRK